MKLTTIAGAGGPVPAALLSNGSLVDLAIASAKGLTQGPPISDVAEILDLDGGLDVQVRRLVDRLEGGEDGLLDRLSDLGALHDNANATYAPLLHPRLIFCGSMGYREHMEEMDTALPQNPTGFIKSVGALAAHKAPLRLPSQDPDMMDYECEFSCVIGRAFHNVEPEEAIRCVAGYTMANDLGSRTHVPAWMDALKGNDPMASFHLNTLVMFDKQFPGCCPVGPVVVTADAFGDPNDVTVETRLNGEVMQSAHTSDLIFSLAYSLSYFSRWFRFQPGDIVTTGSPSGVGIAQNPPRFLRPGDVVEVSARDIGTLTTPVIGSTEAV